MFVLSILVFLSFALAGVALYLYFTPDRARQRVRSLAAEAAENTWSESALRLVEPLAELSVPQGAWEDSPLRMKLMNAGIRHDDARLWYLAAKTALPLVLALASFLVVQAALDMSGLDLLLVVLLAALFGAYLPNLVVHVLRESRQREIFETFPDAADLLLVCVEAGLGLDAALTKVTDEMSRKSAALTEELHLTNLEIRAGASREVALRNLAIRTGVDEMMTFASMLAQADRFGTSLGDSLRVFSEELRHKREARAEERAAKIPTKLLFPLVVFIFPSVIMVILGPAMIQIIRSILPLLTGI